jgi:hypothetical protein
MMKGPSLDEVARKHRYRLFITVESILLLITVLLCIGLFALSAAHVDIKASGWMLSVLISCMVVLPVLSLWHVVALPICFMYLIGKPIIMTLSPLIASAESRAFRKQLRERPTLADEEFYSRYYEGSNIPRDIPARLRRSLGVIDPLIDRVTPFDFLYLLDDELDFNDVICLTEREFGVRFTKMENESIDGTLDNLIRLIHMRIIHPS